MTNVRIITKQNGDRPYWRVDRPSIYRKGFRDDVPPAALISGGVAGLMVPFFIIAFSAAAEGGYEWMWPVAIATTALFVVSLVFAFGLMYRNGDFDDDDVHLGDGSLQDPTQLPG